MGRLPIRQEAVRAELYCALHVRAMRLGIDPESVDVTVLQDVWVEGGRGGVLDAVLSVRRDWATIRISDVIRCGGSGGVSRPPDLCIAANQGVPSGERTQFRARATRRAGRSWIGA